MISLTVGDTLLCLVWSLTNPHQDNPYSIALRQGAKPRLVCTCPAFSIHGQGRTCKHVHLLREKVRQGTIMDDEHFKLTPEGMSHFRVRGAT